MVAHEAPTQSPEKQKTDLDIPKSREIFTGDINDAVITVQEITGFEITPEWWVNEVGNDGPTEDILDRFDSAFERFVMSENIEVGHEVASEAQILTEAGAEVERFEQKFADHPEEAPLPEEFLDDLGNHLKEKYNLSETEDAMETVETGLRLTTPESRHYGLDEDYRFLVHVPLGNVAERGDEIGHERGDTKLMTSLISQEHQGTFLGEGGIIVAQPSEESISGIASIDVGGEIQAGRKDDIDEITAPAPPFEYNQIDMDFDGTKPIGVLIKQTPEGEQLGSAQRNESLVAYAEEHDLQVVTIAVEPAETLTEPKIDVVELPNEQGERVTVDLPYSDSEFMRIQVLRIGKHNVVYHANGESSIGRTMKINQYGEATQELTTDEEKVAVHKLRQFIADGEERLFDEDVATVERGLEALRKNS